MLLEEVAFAASQSRPFGYWTLERTSYLSMETEGVTCRSNDAFIREKSSQCSVFYTGMSSIDYVMKYVLVR